MSARRSASGGAASSPRAGERGGGGRRHIARLGVRRATTRTTRTTATTRIAFALAPLRRPYDSTRIIDAAPISRRVRLLPYLVVHDRLERHVEDERALGAQLVEVVAERLAAERRARHRAEPLAVEVAELLRDEQPPPAARLHRVQTDLCGAAAAAAAVTAGRRSRESARERTTPRQTTRRENTIRERERTTPPPPKTVARPQQDFLKGGGGRECGRARAEAAVANVFTATGNRFSHHPPESD